MLFDLAMGALHFLFIGASEMGVLASLARTWLRQRVSLFGDDAMVFLTPSEDDVRASLLILDVVGLASGLRVNLEKCAAFPI